MKVLLEKFSSYGICCGADVVPENLWKYLEGEIYLIGGLNLYYTGREIISLKRKTYNGKYKYKEMNNFEEAKNEIKEIKPNIIHSHTRGEKLTEINKEIKESYNIPWIHTIHGFDEINGNYFEHFKNVDLLTTPSPYSAEKLEEKLETLNIEKLVIPVPNPIEIKNDSDILRKSEKIRNNLGKEEFLILIPGRLQEDKGFFETADAVIELLNEGYKDVKLIHIGFIFSDNEKKKLENKFKKTGYEDKLCICGYVPSEDLSGYYKAVNVVCIPSDTTNETFSLAVGEALGLGTPVITSNIGATKELWVDTGFAIGVEPKNKDDVFEKLKYVYENYEKIKSSIENKKYIIERDFHPVKISKIWEKIYQNFL